MQLQKVRLDRLDDLRKLRVTGIDAKRDLERAPAHAFTQGAGVCKDDIARGRRKEDEADHVGAGGERRIERLRRIEAANLDEKGHVRRAA